MKITAYLVSIGQLQRFLNKNIPGLTAYFDNTAVYFKNVWQPWKQPALIEVGKQQVTPVHSWERTVTEYEVELADHMEVW